MTWTSGPTVIDVELAHFYHRFTETAGAAAYASRLPKEDRAGLSRGRKRIGRPLLTAFGSDGAWLQT
jgi:hypothetical protein